jgi:hypothetical protein
MQMNGLSSKELIVLITAQRLKILILMRSIFSLRRVPCSMSDIFLVTHTLSFSGSHLFGYLLPRPGDFSLGVCAAVNHFGAPACGLLARPWPDLTLLEPRDC